MPKATKVVKTSVGDSEKRMSVSRLVQVRVKNKIRGRKSPVGVAELSTSDLFEALNASSTRPRDADKISIELRKRGIVDVKAEATALKEAA